MIARALRSIPAAAFRSSILAVGLLLSVSLIPSRPLAAQSKADVSASLDARAEHFSQVALSIYELAELGYLEEKSSKLLQAELAEAGFRVEAGVEGMPTAFVAEWGSGSPVIGVLAEFDALPGISQDPVPHRQVNDDKNAGHACGHHLFGTASTAAAIAVKEWLEATGQGGTIRLYGTPAEEGGSGKVYMVRGGRFDDVDLVLSWHAGDRNSAAPSTNLAVKSAKFRFSGISAHAAAAPERGRSALDGVEAMNIMANMMREHVPQETRIHYVITQGGFAPNVVPEQAEVYYYVRNPDPAVVKSVFDRLTRIAEGAALGTGTSMEFEVIGGAYSYLPNETLSQVLHENLQEVGGVHYDASERAFAAAIQTSFDNPPPLAQAAEIAPFVFSQTYASSDAGDVSWVVPTAQLRAATWVPGTAAHSWQAIASGGTSIGTKGMMVAAKTIARTAIDLFRNPDAVSRVRAEFAERRGADFVYEPLLGDRAPALDYRLGSR